MRNCSKCGTPFEPTEAAAKKWDWRCRSCKNAARVVSAAKRKAEGKPYAIGKASKEWWREYNNKPEERLKKATRARTRYAIKQGKLERKPCEMCGELKSEAHHEDYSNHMAVMWLCDTHHKQHHQARGEAYDG